MDLAEFPASAPAGPMAMSVAILVLAQVRLCAIVVVDQELAAPSLLLLRAINSSGLWRLIKLIYTYNSGLLEIDHRSIHSRLLEIYHLVFCMLFSGVSISITWAKLETMQNKDHICTLLDAGFIIVAAMDGGVFSV